ncbi:MAG: hypothetical protein M3486_00400, partial [Actinomycetota bacterium]|nr:hypothetical protein [Actinomycetota bacterium]
MTGPFAPPPADGADGWSDQDPTSARTPVPPDPAVPEPRGETEAPSVSAGTPPVQRDAAPAAAPVVAVSLVKAPAVATTSPSPTASPPPSAAPAAPATPVPVPQAEPDTGPAAAPVAADPSPPKVSLSKAPPGDAPPMAPAAGGRGALPLALVGALTALMVLGVGYLGYRLNAERQTEAAREQAITASRDAARLLFSYDYTTLDEDFAKGLSVTTGQFRDDYSRTTTDVVAGVARQYKAVVVADVVESAVIDAAPDEVTTLVFLNQATTSTQIT